MLRNLLNDETGAVVSAELILIVTITFGAAAVGWSTIGSAVTTELNDISEMIGSVDQSYKIVGHAAPADGFDHGESAAAGFNDTTDVCDCKGLQFNTTCGKTQDAALQVEQDDAGGADG